MKNNEQLVKLQVAVAVFVLHSVKDDEFVCQLPIFPPYQSPDDFDRSLLKSIISRCLGLSEHNLPLKVDIISIRSWTMSALVADSYDNCVDFGLQRERCQERSSSLNLDSEINRDRPTIFLVGDAAHQFPPAGGFGMNTVIVIYF
jgi:hypothetical protein